jgi:predicted RNA-binding Zn-ribbon protein involved in translation (DUF1610 family)
MVTRFQEDKEPQRAFADTFYVQCPQCGGCAIVRRIEAELARPSVYLSVRRKLALRPHQVTVFARLVCPKCGHTKDLGTDGWSSGTATDSYFRLPLWFQMPCCGETLWAYNRPHLAYLKRYVEADLREEGVAGKRGLASKLPKWMKAAKNRDEVLKCIQKLMQC